MVTSENGTLISSIKYYPYGDCRNSQGDPGTDILFTGQRLDGTGLYYYGARYYDPVTGRFISPDPTIPDGGNPQSFNRYSYCINNPTSAIDPSGLDYIFVCGAFGTADSWQTMIDGLNIGKNEKIIIIEDALCMSVYEVQDQEAQLSAYLASGELTDVKIIGHSEGAAATINVLDRLANDETFLADTNVREQIKGAVMLDNITGGPLGLKDLAVEGWDDVAYNNLPSELYDAGMDVTLLDVWNTSSIVHSTNAMPGWDDTNTYSYCSGVPFNPFYLQGYMNAVFGTIVSYHGDPRTNQKVIDKINETFNNM